MISFTSFTSVPTGSLKILDNPVFCDSNFDQPLMFSLILPTFNESSNIQKIITIIDELLAQTIPEQYELIVVDDNSPDGTYQLAQELTTICPRLRVMRRETETGLSSAVVRGWQVARGEILGVIDADLQHPPEVLHSLWQEMMRGADIAIASRHVEGGGVSQWNLMRRFLSRGAQMLGLLILPEVISRLSDPMSGYFLVRRDVLAGKVLSPVGYKILIEVVARGKIRWISEVGYIFRERQGGESKVKGQHYLEYIQHLVRLRFKSASVSRFMRFCVAGFSGVFVNMAILFVLREFIGLGLTRSAMLAAEIAIVNNFFWNDIWTFQDISRRQKGWRKRVKRFLKFNLICLSGLILNVLIINLLYNLWGINEYIANLIAIAIITFWNFWFNLKLSWRVTDAN